MSIAIHGGRYSRSEGSLARHLGVSDRYGEDFMFAVRDSRFSEMVQNEGGGGD